MTPDRALNILLHGAWRPAMHRIKWTAAHPTTSVPAHSAFRQPLSSTRRPSHASPLRRLREAGPPTPAQVEAILAPDVVMHSPVLIKPIKGRELVAITISNSSRSREATPEEYIFESKVDERTTLLRWQGIVPKATRSKVLSF